MKSFFSKLADILYALKDYIIILAIVLTVFGIIAWRLDSMFTHKITPEEDQVLSGVVEPIRNGDTTIEGEGEVIPDETLEPVDEDPAVPEGEDEEEEEAVPISREEFTLSIPEDFSLDDIDALLIEKGVITRPNHFVEKVQTLGLDESITPGDYRIPTAYNLDDVVLMITSS